MQHSGAKKEFIPPCGVPTTFFSGKRKHEKAVEEKILNPLFVAMQRGGPGGLPAPRNSSEGYVAQGLAFDDQQVAQVEDAVGGWGAVYQRGHVAVAQLVGGGGDFAVDDFVA